MRRNPAESSPDHPDYQPPFDPGEDEDYLTRARAAIVRDVKACLAFADEVLTETILAPSTTAAKEAGASLALAFQRAVNGDEKGAAEEFLRASQAIMAAYPDCLASQRKGAPTNLVARARVIGEADAATARTDA
jgi:hypothetical protein